MNRLIAVYMLGAQREDRADRTHAPAGHDSGSAEITIAKPPRDQSDPDTFADGSGVPGRRGT